GFEAQEVQARKGIVPELFGAAALVQNTVDTLYKLAQQRAVARSQNHRVQLLMGTIHKAHARGGKMLDFAPDLYVTGPYLSYCTNIQYRNAPHPDALGRGVGGRRDAIGREVADHFFLHEA